MRAHIAYVQQQGRRDSVLRVQGPLLAIGVVVPGAVHLILGSDGALLLSWIHIILSEGLYDKEFVVKWTNAPMLVSTDTFHLLLTGYCRKPGPTLRPIYSSPTTWSDPHQDAQ